MDDSTQGDKVGPMSRAVAEIMSLQAHRKGISRAELARRIAMGQTMANKTLAGKRAPLLDEIKAMCGHLQLDWIGVITAAEQIVTGAEGEFSALPAHEQLARITHLLIDRRQPGGARESYDELVKRLAKLEGNQSDPGSAGERDGS